MAKSILVALIFGLLMGNIVSASASPPPPKEDTAEEDSEFLAIPPISVAMYNKRKRPAGTMTIVMQLKIDDKDQREEARKIIPRLTNAYMQESLRLALNFFDISRPVNANILSRSLQNATNKILRHGQARVLIGDIAVQKRR